VCIYNSLHKGGLGENVFQRHIKSAIVLIFGHFYGITLLIHTYKNNFTINMYLYINKMLTLLMVFCHLKGVRPYLKPHLNEVSMYINVFV
jgi:hypothetical protein